MEYIIFLNGVPARRASNLKEATVKYSRLARKYNDEYDDVFIYCQATGKIERPNK